MNSPDRPSTRQRLASELNRQLVRKIARQELPQANKLAGYLSFSGILLEKILALQKTQTRRPVKPAGLSLQQAALLPCHIGQIHSQVGLLERWAYDEQGHVVHAHGSDRKLRWNAGTFMPRHACRYSLLLARVEAQYLSDISIDDARAEGFGSKEEFLAAWDQFYGSGEFASNLNPVIWAIAFELSSNAAASH